MQWLQVGISAGKALTQKQYTLEGGAQYVNVWDSEHLGRVYGSVQCVLV